ncbi:MAG: hypothetical protein OEU91_06965 [Gammaproteobacteria bacterium]|nr:hypothetical protein [Gammaproteobacteria bacterium]
MNRIRLTLLGLALALPTALPASADVLLVDSLSASASISTPASGVNMPQVRQQFGNPLTEHPSVSVSGGPLQPPITRWDYAGFSVFFEHDRVVHSVTHRAAGN